MVGVEHYKKEYEQACKNVDTLIALCIGKREEKEIEECEERH